MRLKTTVRTIGRPLKIVLCGLENAGKTAMYLRLKTGKFHHNLKPTLSTTMDTIKILSEDFFLSAAIIDLGGQKRLRDQWMSHICISDVIIFVIDINDYGKFTEAKKEFIERVYPNIGNKPCIIACNKFDLISDTDTTKIENDILALLEMSEADQIAFICTSQKTGFGLPRITSFIRKKLK